MSDTTTARPPLAVLAALSEEKRLRILDVLRDGEHCVCDLMAHMDAAQSLLSHHLKVLKEAGLVTDRKEGRWSYYRMVPDAVAELETFVAGLREDAQRDPSAPKCCAAPNTFELATVEVEP